MLPLALWLPFTPVHSGDPAGVFLFDLGCEDSGVGQLVVPRFSCSSSRGPARDSHSFPWPAARRPSSCCPLLDVSPLAGAGMGDCSQAAGRLRGAVPGPRRESGGSFPVRGQRAPERRTPQRRGTFPGSGARGGALFPPSELSRADQVLYLDGGGWRSVCFRRMQPGVRSRGGRTCLDDCSHGPVFCASGAVPFTEASFHAGSLTSSCLFLASCRQSPSVQVHSDPLRRHFMSVVLTAERIC